MNRKISFRLTDFAGKTVTFEGLRELVEFLNREISFWKAQHGLFDKQQRQLHVSLRYHSNFSQAVQAIESWTSQLDSWNETQLNQQLNSLLHNQLSQTSNQWIWSGHPFIGNFVECHIKHGIDVASAFLNYTVKRQIGNLNQHDAFLGTMIGYEFTNQDSNLNKRRHGEKISLGTLRNQLEETTNKIIGETEKFKESLNAWSNETRENWSVWLKEAQSEQSTQHDKHRDEFISYMDGCKTRMDELERTYQEKLRLEKPAQYWKASARKFGIQGGLWTLALIASILLGFVYFSNFFTAWLQGQETAVQLNAIQGVVIFGTLLATFAFLVRTLSRLAFSSFHLMRDAEEREQLTYLYLSLINGQQIDQDSRDIILQALFSRSETGLLTSESGPTMPGISEIIKDSTKSR